MDSSNESCNTVLICGNVTRLTSKFNEETQIKSVDEYVRQAFIGNLPMPYRIVYYDPMTKVFVNLDDQLRNGLNAFHTCSMNSVQSMVHTTGCIRLYIVSDVDSQRDKNSDGRETQIHSSVATLETEDDQIVSSGAFNGQIDNVNSVSTNEDVSQDSCSTYDRSLPLISPSINLLEAQTRSKRLTFDLDVKPSQRDVYRSDQFSVRKDKANGRIARVQGVKTAQEKMLQVLPKLRIPSCYLQSPVTLSVTVVSETLEDGMRVWCKHPNKGFLPDGYEKDTQPINPITFHLDQSNGEFTLSLQMITKWNKSQRKFAEVYRYDDRRTRELHSAEHDNRSPRLLCVLQQNGENDWDTFCLSDFIRIPKPSKQRSSSVTTERTPSTERKRLKTKD